MKKKTLSIILCTLLCSLLCSTAFADLGNVNFQQVWSVTGTDQAPDEDPALTVTADPDNPDLTKVITLTKGSDGTVSVNYPEGGYSTIGIYKYIISQAAGTAQGATYDADPIGIEVLVGFKNDVLDVVQVGLSKVGEVKKDKFENAYTVGSLTVTHEVSGNTGNKNGEFPVTITLHAEKTVKTPIHYSVNGIDQEPVAVDWTGNNILSLSLKGDGSAVFSDIPEGITYSIDADAVTNYETNVEGGTGTITYALPSSVSITRESETNLQTGISLDIIPYIIILAVVIGGLFLLLLRRRREEQDN